MGRVASPPGRSTLVFDGDCEFCRYWIRRWQSVTAGRVDFVPWQEAAGSYPEISADAFQESVHLIGPDGSVATGARAVLTALAAAPGRGFPLRAYERIPGVATVAEGLYRFVARRRRLFSALTRRFRGR